jgi:hypothetical protein
MNGERFVLVQQVLDNYLALRLFADEPEGDPAIRLTRLLDRLSPAELQAVATSFAILADAAQRRGTPPAHPDADGGC